MKRGIIMRGIITILVAMCFLMAGCMNEEKTITMAQIKDIFENHDIPLKEPTELNTRSVFLMTLNDVAPEPFIINDGQLISVYLYSSSDGVKKAIKDFEDKTATGDVSAHDRYQIANVMIIHDHESPGTDERVEMAVKELKSLVR
jgi:hypothetical protein